MEAEKIGVFELYQKIKKYNMDFFPLNNEVYYIRLFTRENFFCAGGQEYCLYLFNCQNEHVATIYFGGVDNDDNYLMNVRLNRYKYYFVFAYHTEEQYRNKGIMTEFVSYITNCIFMFYDKVALFIDTNNIKSEKVAIKCGYQFIRYTYNYDGLFMKTDKTFKNIEYPKYNYIEFDSKVVLPKGNTPMLYKYMESKNFVVFNSYETASGVYDPYCHDELFYMKEIECFKKEIKRISKLYNDFYVFHFSDDPTKLSSIGFEVVPESKLRVKNNYAYWLYKLVKKGDKQ